MSFASIMKEVNKTERTISPPGGEKIIDREKWQLAGQSFITQTIQDLWGPPGEKPFEYLLKRGIKQSTIADWKLGFSSIEGWGDAQEWGLLPEDKIWIPAGITIPNFEGDVLHGIKIRKREGEPRYVLLKGSEIWLYGSDTFKDSAILYLFEGEFDCLLAWQTEYKLSYGALPAGQNIKREYQELFKPIEDVIVCYDNDERGIQAAEKLCQLPHFWNSVSLPHGKDLTEYAQSGGDVLEWLMQQTDHLGRCLHGTR
ncbi:MAG: toprim domain-containing protein [Anaerolineales bacterium]